MSAAYAEVIGDPIAQTRSPTIHRHWLATLGLPGDYRAVRVRPAELAGYFAARRGDPDWRGCNVTIPHKRSVLPLLDRVDPAAATIGAVNCILPESGGLAGFNTDIDGLALALASAPIKGRKVALIGAGGGARAAIGYLLDASAAEIAVLARDPVAHFDDARVALFPFDDCDAAFAGAAAIVNATPLGMTGAPPMPEPLLACVARHASGATLLDMVYDPIETAFLAAGRAGGGAAVGGLVMLIGQARAAFRFFYGHEPPHGDEAARASLAAG